MQIGFKFLTHLESKRVSLKLFLSRSHALLHNLEYNPLSPDSGTKCYNKLNIWPIHFKFGCQKDL